MTDYGTIRRSRLPDVLGSGIVLAKFRSEYESQMGRVDEVEFKGDLCTLPRLHRGRETSRTLHVRRGGRKNHGAAGCENARPRGKDCRPAPFGWPRTCQPGRGIEPDGFRSRPLFLEPGTVGVDESIQTI